PAGDGAAVLVGAMQQCEDANGLNALVTGLSAIAPHLDAADAERAAKDIAERMRQTTDANIAGSMAQGLVSLAARLKPADAAQAAHDLLLAMRDAKGPNLPNTLAFLAQSQAGLTAGLDKQEAADIVMPTAQLLVDVMKNSKDAYSTYTLATALSQVAARLG